MRMGEQPKNQPLENQPSDFPSPRVAFTADAGVLLNLFEVNASLIQFYDGGAGTWARTRPRPCPTVKRVISELMRIATNFQQPRQAARPFQGQPVTNGATGIVAILSRNSLDKMLSSTAVNKSENPLVHSMAVANADCLFQRAMLGWSKQDRDNDPGLAAIHRFFAPMEIDGRMKLVKVTVKETARRAQSNTLYTVEIVEFNEKSPAATWVESAFQSDGIDPKSILSARDVLNLAQALEERNRSAHRHKTSPPMSL